MRIHEPLGVHGYDPSRIRCRPHTKDGTVLNVSNGHFSKEDAYDGLMDYMRRWMMHRNPNLER